MELITLKSEIDILNKRIESEKEVLRLRVIQLLNSLPSKSKAVHTSISNNIGIVKFSDIVGRSFGASSYLDLYPQYCVLWDGINKLESLDKDTMDEYFKNVKCENIVMSETRLKYLGVSNVYETKIHITEETINNFKTIFDFYLVESI
jgi:hypothetical protein